MNSRLEWYAARAKEMTNSCYHCAHLVREQESWEMPHIEWWECAARPGCANLTSFPFVHTKCTAFSPNKASQDKKGGRK